VTDTIYVVDDNELNLKMVSAALKAVGYEIATAQNAAEVLLNIGTVRPVLAILDVMMPDMDGYELCRRLRSRPETSNIPIIILTTLSELDERLKAFEAGADDFIAKPFNPQELQARVKVLLRRFTPQEAPVTTLQAETTAVFSLRGGVGVSTVATNLSVGLAQVWPSPVCLVDMALVSGQSALMLDIPLRNSWGDLAGVRVDEIDSEIIQRILLSHESGLRVLACPKRFEDAELLGVDQVQRTLSLLKSQFEYLVFDLPHDFSAITVAALDAADRIVLLLSPELSSVRCASIALEVFDKLNYPPEKIKLLLNWTFPGKGLARVEIEKAIKRKVDIVLPNVGDALVSALTYGKPPVFQDPNGAIGALFEDLAYHWSKESHRSSSPQPAKDGYKRVRERARARQKQG
jgi:pilus assembly protein CpaE